MKSARRDLVGWTCTGCAEFFWAMDDGGEKWCMYCARPGEKHTLRKLSRAEMGLR